MNGAYLLLILITTSTGLAGLPGTSRTLVTFPMGTPWKSTGWPGRTPSALSKKVTRVIFLVRMPLVPLIRKTRIARVTEATMTVIPTLSSDHLSCFWLGKLYVVLRGNHSRWVCKSLEADSFRSVSALDRLRLRGENA